MCEVMIEITAGTETDENVRKELVQGVSFYFVENVCLYEINNTTTVMTIEPTHKAADTNVYFVIDTLEENAFGHWVYESAVFLPYFHLFKARYPALKLVCHERKTYKYLFYKYFDISMNDIVYDINIDCPNLCIFPETGMHLTIGYTTPQFEQILVQFCQEVQRRMPTDIDPFIEYCIMPRQTKENYAPNDRRVPFGEIYECFENLKIPYQIMETDKVDDLNDQIRAIQRARAIILVDGSALMVNGIFCKGKPIFVVGQTTYKTRTLYPRMMLIVNMNQKRDNCYFLNDQHAVVEHFRSLYSKT